MPLCYALQVRTEDVCLYGLCRGFAYRPFDFYTVLHTVPLIFTRFCIPWSDFYTILHTVTLVFTSFCIPRSDCCTFLHTEPEFLHGFAYRDPIFYTVLHTETWFFTSFCTPNPVFLHVFAYTPLFFYMFLHRPPCFFARFCIPLGFSGKNCIDLMQKFTDFCAKISKIQCKNCTQK